MSGQVKLTQATRTADLDAFNRLVLAHQDRVFQHVCWMLGEQRAAEDLTQQTFLQAYQELAGFRGGDFGRWLLKIASRLCLEASCKPEDPGLKVHDGLTPELRAVVGLVEFQGIDYAGTAEILGIPISSVGNRLMRARMQLGKLGDHYKTA